MSEKEEYVWKEIFQCQKFHSCRKCRAVQFYPAKRIRMILNQLWKTLLFAKRTTVAESPCKSIFKNPKGKTDPYARPRRYLRMKKCQRRKNTYGRRFFNVKNSIAAENAVQYNFIQQKEYE